MGAPLSEDGQAFDPSKGYGGQGQAGERVSVGDGSDPGGVPPDEEKQGQEIERTWLDSAVELAGYLNLEFGEGTPEGDRYGVPGGWLGWIPGSKVTQGIYVAVSAVMAVITVVELAVGIGEAKLAAKAGIAAIRTLGVKGAVKFFWDDALKKAASLGGMLLRRNKDEAAEGAEAAARLLPDELAVDTAGALRRAGTKGDDITPHHIPSAKHMSENHGVRWNDGIAINMEQPTPGSGGRHRRTFTYGTQADRDLGSRDALARGIWDARQRYIEDGLYGPEVRRALQEVIRQNKAKYPNIFQK